MAIPDVMAFVGTGLAAASVGWQVAAYRQGGSKIQFSSRLALSGPDLYEDAEDSEEYDDDEDSEEYDDDEDSEDTKDPTQKDAPLETMTDDDQAQSPGESISRDFVSTDAQPDPPDLALRPLPHNPLLIATLSNRGQTSMQMLSCDLRIQTSRSSRRKQTWIDFSFDSSATARGVLALGDGTASVVESPALPYILPPNSRTEWALPILSFLPMVKALNLEHSPATLDVSFGNGRRKRITIDVPSVLEFEAASDA